jgi:hypothetical protein
MSDDGQPVELKIKEVEIWRQVPGDYYSPYIFSTGTDGIGIAVGGYVAVKPVRAWHEQSAQLRAETARADAAEKRAERFREALVTLSKGNRSPGVLAIARAALHAAGEGDE